MKYEESKNTRHQRKNTTSYEDKKNLFTNRYSTSVNSVPMDLPSGGAAGDSTRNSGSRWTLLPDFLMRNFLYPTADPK